MTVSGDTVVASPNVYFEPAGGWAGVLTENGRLTRSDGSPPAPGDVHVDGNTVVAGFCDNQDLGSACVFEGLDTDPLAEPPTGPTGTTRTDCRTGGCRIPLTCNAAQNCINPIRLLIRARDVQLREAARAKAPRLIGIAAALANIPPGATQPVRLKPTKRGRDIFKNNKKRRLRGILEIRNTPGTAINRRPITIRLR